MSDQPILLDLTETVAIITLNRPEKLNAINMPMLAALEVALAELEQSDSIRAVIITGAGERAFCAGADITAWSALPPLDMWRQWIRAGHRLFGRLARLRQPVIAALNGYTFGGGLELALAADIRLAASQAELGLPEVKIGAVPAWTGSQRLPVLIGPARAKQMIFSGDNVSAAVAERWGLVNEVLAPEALVPRAHELAAKIAANAPIAVQVAKQLLDGAMGQAADYALEALAAGLVAQTEDGQEGPAAFRERRGPVFRDQ